MKISLFLSILSAFIFNISLCAQGSKQVWYSDTCLCFNDTDDVVSKNVAYRGFTHKMLGNIEWKNEYFTGPFFPHKGHFDELDPVGNLHTRTFYLADSAWVLQKKSKETYRYFGGLQKSVITSQAAPPQDVYVDSFTYDIRGRIKTRVQYTLDSIYWKRLHLDTFAYSGNYMIFSGSASADARLNSYYEYYYYGDSSRYQRLFFKRGMGVRYDLYGIDSAVNYSISGYKYTVIKYYEVDTDTLLSSLDTLIESGKGNTRDKRLYLWQSGSLKPQGRWVEETHTDGRGLKKETYLHGGNTWQLYEGAYWRYANKFIPEEYTLVVGHDSLKHRTYFSNLGFPVSDSIFTKSRYSKWTLSKYCTHRQYFVLNTPENTLGRYSVKIYPNPASEDIIIELPQGASKGATLHVFASGGRLLEKRELDTADDVHMSLRGFPTGVYSVVIFNAESFYTGGFIKKGRD
jgi:hypothetical protein